MSETDWLEQFQNKEADVEPETGKPRGVGFGTASGLKKIYCCGHGVWKFREDGFFTVPDGTTVTFYTLHGKGLSAYDANANLRGENIGPPVRVVQPGESCPNMTLLPESSEEEKDYNEANAKLIEKKGHRMVQTRSAPTTLESIVGANGPGHNYVWNACYEYDVTSPEVRLRDNALGFKHDLNGHYGSHTRDRQFGENTAAGYKYEPGKNDFNTGQWQPPEPEYRKGRFRKGVFSIDHCEMATTTGTLVAVSLTVIDIDRPQHLAARSLVAMIPTDVLATVCGADTATVPNITEHVKSMLPTLTNRVMRVPVLTIEPMSKYGERSFPLKTAKDFTIEAAPTSTLTSGWDTLTTDENDVAERVVQRTAHRQQPTSKIRAMSPTVRSAVSGSDAPIAPSLPIPGTTGTDPRKTVREANEAIAKELGKNAGEISKLLVSIYAKLGVSSREQLVTAYMNRPTATRS